MQHPHLDLNNPSSVYEFVKGQVSDLVYKLEEVQKGNLKVDSNQHSEALDILNQMAEKIDISLDKFKKNAEWKNFSIAFFGETNAGKSTLIETLRILLKEKTKVDQQTKYNQILNNNESSVSQENTIVTAKRNELNLEYQAIKDEISRFDVERKRIMDLYNKEYTSVTINNDQIKTHVLKQKKLLIKKYNIELEKNEVEKKQFLEASKENLLKIETALSLLDELQKPSENFNHDDYEKKVEDLLLYADGQIIGTGRSDFTLDSTSYEFEINKFTTNLLDVPGIEGKEILVENEIEKAVQKSHAVFYVTAKDAPPNEGTLNRIKNYLHDQTEVWVIYNKQMTNVRMLKDELISSMDEKDALSDLERKLKSTFGQNYKELITIAGLPAFLSQASCLMPDSPLHLQQEKFLAKKSKKEIAELSGLYILKKTIEDKIVGDVPSKIQKSNFNKVKSLLDIQAFDLNQVKENYKLFSQDITIKINSAKNEIDGHFINFEGSVKQGVNRKLDDFKRNVRTEIYSRIESEISNKEFKQVFDGIIKNEVSVFENEIQNMIKSSGQNLAEKIENTQQELLRDINKLSHDYSQYSQMKNLDLSLEFKLDSGIKTTALIGTLLGVGVAMWWNPVGWVAISATVLGLVFSFAKAIWGFFSSKYQIEQQKKNVDNNLPKITSQLDKEVQNSIAKLVKHTFESKLAIKDKFDEIPKSIDQVNKDLKNAITQITLISEQLTTK